jgi:hypothetical protein
MRVHAYQVPDPGNVLKKKIFFKTNEIINSDENKAIFNHFTPFTMHFIRYFLCLIICLLAAFFPLFLVFF